MAIELTHYYVDDSRLPFPHVVTDCSREVCRRDPFRVDEQATPQENAARLVEALHSIDSWNEIKVVMLLATTVRDQLAGEAE